MKEEILTLMREYEKRHKVWLEICYYSDGKHHCYDYQTDYIFLFEFSSESELIAKLKE